MLSNVRHALRSLRRAPAFTLAAVAMVVRHGAVLAVIGLAVGLGCALALSRLLSSLLFRVSPTDPPTFATGTVVLTAVAVLAAAIPAQRAALTDPMVALRKE
jgi:ABC-type antimicrobial peptide transport system permease subunit